jgi:glyoxylase-like metal-dependent hydrolase (beta-lactamase superfamily II)
VRGTGRARPAAGGAPASLRALMRAPTDPRLEWRLPAFGEMPVVARPTGLVTRVLAPNPSPMTLDGTNTYVVGAAGRGAVAVVDPGPDDDRHLRRVESVLSELDAEVDVLLVTHHHADHAAAAERWSRHLGATIAAPTREVAGPQGRVLGDGDRLDVAGLAIEVVATPGHTRDHVAFRLPDGSMLVGDHVLGRGTSVVAHPDGDLAAYLGSLRAVLDLGPDLLLPGHGPELTEDPAAVIDYYLAHRAHRERQVLEALVAGPRTPRGIVEVVYADVDRRLWDAAEASTRAAVDKLVRERRVAWDGEQVRRVEPAS